MGFIEELKQEHQSIERELLELESIRNSEEINYPNLVHTLKSLYIIWDTHEKKEEDIFPRLESIAIRIPVQTMLSEHTTLKPHKEAIKRACESGDNLQVKKALHVDATIIIEKLRKHISFEDEVLYRIVIDEQALEKIENL